jgi:Protein of unknown function (DUF3300)
MADDIRISLDRDSISLSSRRRMVVLSVVTLAMVALPAQAQTERKPFSPEELDQMLAPIALYSDALLSQVLMASTYPLEIVEAARWSQANASLKGDAAVTAVAEKSWDVSVKSLVAFPPVLSQLNEHLDWTQKLGDALIGQEQDVAASIQRLRAKAAEAGSLKSGKEQTVTTQSQGTQQIIAIEPADPQVVYVPTYDPNTAYGQWSNPGYPPTYYPTGGALLSGLTWGLGFAAARAMFGGWNWGGGGGYMNINASRAVNIDRNFNRANVGTGNRWQHDVNHRKGVAYRDSATRQQYGQARPGADQRQQFRGQSQRPGGAGNVASARPGAGPGGGPGAGNRPGGGAGGGNVQRPGGGAGGGNVQRPGGGAGGGNVQRPDGGSGGRPSGGNGLSGVNRGQQVNREAQRGRAQQQRAATSRGGARAGGGGRPGGGGGRR